jgi:exodeoxyribonuclease III
MKIATFNTNSIRSRQEVILDWLGRESPDALGLQETKVQDQDFPMQPFVDAGYHCEFRGQKSYNGVAVLSKAVPGRIIHGFDDGDETAAPRLITVEIDGIVIVNTYMPQGQAPDSDKFQYKLHFFRRVREFLDRHFTPDQPLVWLGDLNIAPEPIDVYDPIKLLGNVCYHPDVHRELADVLAWGLLDVFRKHMPGPEQYTFWDYRLPNALKAKLGWRLDHIYATKPLYDRSVSARIDIAPRLGPKPSDHTFVIAEFT